MLTDVCVCLFSLRGNGISPLPRSDGEEGQAVHYWYKMLCCELLEGWKRRGVVLWRGAACFTVLAARPPQPKGDLPVVTK